MDQLYSSIGIIPGLPACYKARLVCVNYRREDEFKAIGQYLREDLNVSVQQRDQPIAARDGGIFTLFWKDSNVPHQRLLWRGGARRQGIKICAHASRQKVRKCAIVGIGKPIWTRTCSLRKVLNNSFNLC